MKQNQNQTHLHGLCPNLALQTGGDEQPDQLKCLVPMALELGLEWV